MKNLNKVVTFHYSINFDMPTLRKQADEKVAQGYEVYFQYPDGHKQRYTSSGQD